MASLTPGLLQKLLENAGNKDVKVTGEHRSALLQVLEILPSLTGADDDDPWKSRGFFIKLSDSRHSVYVSVQDEDMDLVYSDKIQLGQFVYISGLDSGSPVPVVRGLKPVPKRRPCVGNPKDLVSSDVLSPKGNIIFARVKNNNGLRKNIGVQGLESRRLSLDSARRIWDQTGFNSGLKTSSNHVNSQKKAPTKNDSPMKSPISSISPLKSKNGVSSFSKHIAKPDEKKDLRSKACKNMPSCLVKVPISTTTKTWSEERISWNTLNPVMHNLGKDIMHHKNVASLAAARALEEASAAETLILCLKEFGDLCGSCQNISSGPLVEQYLDIHQNMQKAATLINSLLTALAGGSKSSFYNKNAAFWVHAAIETNLSKFILFKKPEKKSDGNTENPCHCLVLGNSENQSPPKKQSPRNHHRNLSNSIPKEAGLREMASLAEKLLLHSRQWFFKYIDNSLSNGFHFCIGEASEIAGLLRQLKRVNQWLDDPSNGGGDKGKVEDLRKKIYRFLLAHAHSAGN